MKFQVGSNIMTSIRLQSLLAIFGVGAFAAPTSSESKAYSWSTLKTVSSCPFHSPTSGLIPVPVHKTTSSPAAFTALVQANGEVAQQFVAPDKNNTAILFESSNSSQIQLFLPTQQRAILDNYGARLFSNDCSVEMVLHSPNLLKTLNISHGDASMQQRASVAKRAASQIDISIAFLDQCGQPINGHHATAICELLYPALTSENPLEPSYERSQTITLNDNGATYAGSCAVPDVPADKKKCKATVENFLEYPTKGWLGQITNVPGTLALMRRFVAGGVVADGLAAAAAAVDIGAIAIALEALGAYSLAIQVGADKALSQSVCGPLGLVDLQVNAALDTESRARSVAFQDKYPFTAVTGTRTVSLATVTCSTSSTSATATADSCSNPGSCNNFAGCNPGMPMCICATTTEGTSVCTIDEICDQVANCTASSDCPSGYACVNPTCCGTPKCSEVDACNNDRRNRRIFSNLSAQGLSMMGNNPL